MPLKNEDYLAQSRAEVLSKVVVLTGMLGSGKSTVAQMFKVRGAFVVNADELSRELTRPGEPAYESIREAFGIAILTNKGEIDRGKLSRLVFSSADDRRELEEILHPKIRNRAEQLFVKALSEDKHRLIIYEAPVFFESGLKKEDFGCVVVVSAPKEQCLARAVSRLHLSMEEANARYEAQHPLEYKIAHATYVIDNSGSTEETARQVDQIIAKFRKEPETVPQ